MTVYNEKSHARIGTGRSGHLRQRSNDLTDMAMGASPISLFIHIILTNKWSYMGKSVYFIGKTMIAKFMNKESITNPRFAD